MNNVGSLTKRDAWAATFDHVLYELDKPRQDCPIHLPEALAPALPQDQETKEAEQDKLLNDL